jgi:FMN phosphatase YigB (HAD superfamily)
MVANRRPDCFLNEVFNDLFYPALGCTSEDLRETIDRFYAEVFPALKTLTRPNREAVRLVEQAFERGCRIVIATNPLFPRAAVLHRLEWAGLPVEKYPFDLIATFDRFHFSKPHPAFPAECLAALGWPEGPVVMVGDHPHNDILPARRLGLPAYWIADGQDWPAGQPAVPTGRGDLAGLLPWLDRQPEQNLLPDYSSPEALLAILLTTPAVLDGLFRTYQPGAGRLQPSNSEWSLTEILCHLRDVETEVNLPRLDLLLLEDNPFIPGMDTDPWAAERCYAIQDRQAALGRFTAARLKLIDRLAGLPPEDWNRPARHAILGPTHLRELIGIIASHDRLHVRQARAAASS